MHGLIVTLSTQFLLSEQSWNTCLARSLTSWQKRHEGHLFLLHFVSVSCQVNHPIAPTLGNIKKLELPILKHTDKPYDSSSLFACRSNLVARQFLSCGLRSLQRKWIWCAAPLSLLAYMSLEIIESQDFHPWLGKMTRRKRWGGERGSSPREGRLFDKKEGKEMDSELCHRALVRRQK